MMLRLARLRRLDETSHLVDGVDSDLPTSRPHQVLGVVGSGGAPGRTFVSLNLAMALAMDGLRVALVEAGSGLGTVAARLNLKEDRSLAYLGHEARVRPLDRELLERHLQRSGPLDVLGGAFEPGAAGLVAPETFDSVIAMLSHDHDLIVVDLGPLESHLTVAHALRCQTLCWVVAPTPVGVDLFDRVVRSALANPLRAKPSLAVLNGAGQATLTVADTAFLRRYGMPLVATIPFNRRACLRADSVQRPAVIEGELRAPLRAATRAVATHIFHGPSRDPVPDPGPRVVPGLMERSGAES
ncbi:MAG: AAA family ATPase [Candidatus Dormibacteria bacterium]|jgi:MinD-like ATPase involved in chromosome partitioning or flagellar assembly